MWRSQVRKLWRRSPSRLWRSSVKNLWRAMDPDVVIHQQDSCVGWIWNSTNQWLGLRRRRACSYSCWPVLGMVDGCIRKSAGAWPPTSGGTTECGRGSCRAAKGDWA
ncbi:hypothetical protein E2562_032346 [Oryza meyeriana var. granulata]|uniref:Uncharacterized protein n=1 Tax=Oryza meyeriana var. granulata TaxID=110450 RepID=A0A6G1CB61_9ORYZ|nr:hypothetical protein E2562_032346 [Oryza meyeriana var. granulata]